MNSNSTSRKGFQKFEDTELEKTEDIKQKQNKNSSSLAIKEEENEDVDKFIDEIGFTRYHALIFIIAASILICGGVQELMMAIVVSIINEKSELTSFHYAIITSIEYVGYTLSTIVINIITNYVSNKRAIQIFTILNLLFTGLSIIKLNFLLAVIFRFFIGFCFGMIDILIYLNLVESCPTKIRGFVGSIILVFFPLGQFLIAVFCYVILPENREIEEVNNRNLLLIPFIAVAVILIILIPFLKESARRLIALDKVDEGAQVIKQISKFNKNKNFSSVDQENKIDKFVRRRTINLEPIEEIEKQLQKFSKLRKSNTFNISNIQIQKSIAGQEMKKTKNENLINPNQLSHQANKYASTDHDAGKKFSERFLLLLSGNYIKISLILWVCAIFTNFIFNGLFFMLPTTAPTLNKETFKDVLLSVSMEICSSLMTCLVIESKRFGRLRSLRLGYFFTIITCAFCFIIGYEYLIIMCTLKFFITIPANILMIYASEIYDSKNRTFGVSIVNFFKRIATIIAPFAVSYLEFLIGPIGPYYIFSSAALICFCLALFLDVETRGIPLDKVELNHKAEENKENI